MTDRDTRAEVRRSEWAENWDRIVNGRNAGEFLRCYCGEEVAVYHKECLALVEDR